MRPTWSGPRWWRRLPLAAQLATYTISIAAGWVLISQALEVRRDARAAQTRETTAVVSRLETQTEELGSLMLSMQSAQRGFLLTGDENFLVPYVRADIQFSAIRDSALALVQQFESPRLAFEDWLTAMLRWRQEASAPLIALRRSSIAISARDVQQGIARGRLLMDSALMAHGALRGALRAQASVQRVLETDDQRADSRELLLVRIALIATILLLVVLTTRTVRDALNVVVRGAEALAEGEYADARIPPGTASSSAELTRLASAFDRLSIAVSRRETSMQAEIVSLRDLEQMKTEFVSTVSHELRTPLTSVRGALGLILGGGAGPVHDTVKPLLRIALQNTERLVRLINDILDIEKMDAARFEVRRAPVDLRSVLDTTAAGIDGFAREHGVSVRVTGATAVRVVGDSDRLVQLFTNLVSNAVKFSPRGESVDVRLEEFSGRATVEVVDRGPGIPEEFRSRIFGRFQQAAGTSGGTGLGLAIVQRITQLHGGEIAYSPAPGGGTSFKVTLPAASALAPAPAEDDGRARILIVEDDQSMLDVLVALAAPYGHVLTARSAEAALESARQTRADVMLLDPGLQGMSGFELVRRLRALDTYHALPVLVFSAIEHRANEYEDVGIPAAHVFVKSRDPEATVVKRLRAVLAARGLS